MYSLPEELTILPPMISNHSILNYVERKIVLVFGIGGSHDDNAGRKLACNLHKCRLATGSGTFLVYLQCKVPGLTCNTKMWFH
jgi:hypothetical protein